MSAHIFIDNSNVFGGAQRAAASIEPQAPRVAVRVDYGRLFALVEGQHSAATRVLAGSVPPGNEALWGRAKSLGYSTDLLKKIANDTGRLGEQAVDELLHLKIANALLDHSPPATLVLVTGDGGTSDFGTSFPSQASRALKRGWNVEVWSWKEQLSPKFASLTQPGHVVKVQTFDAHYHKIVYIERGEFTVSGKRVLVPGRPVT